MIELVAIHQPNFFPWLGFFDKLVRADRLVLLDNVQFQKKGGTWSNRVRIMVNGEPQWLTAPIDRAYHGVRNISEMKFADSDWRVRTVATIRRAYGRAPHFDEMAALIEPLVQNPDQSLASYNELALTRIAETFGVESSKFVRATNLARVSGAGTELLASIVKAAGGTTYLSGDGAEGYQKDDAYREAGVGLRMQAFRHPTYRQTGAGSQEFHPGMSVIDVVANVGISGARELLGTEAR